MKIMKSNEIKRNGSENGGMLKENKLWQALAKT
jgi:hypothetical protein